MADSKISAIKARELLDSKGRPMVEVDVVTSAGALGRSSSPCGTSVGKHEAVVLRDGGRRFDGLGVRKAVNNVVNIIGPPLIGESVRNQRRIDEIMVELDGTPDKSRLGANALYSVSAAVARAAANDAGLSLYRYLAVDDLHILPTPMFNMINGGPYSDVTVEFQEFLLAPTTAATYAEALRISVEVFYELGRTIKDRYGAGAARAGNYGGYAAPVNEPAAILDCLLEAVERAGYGGMFQAALDCAASHFYDGAKNIYQLQGKELSRVEMIDLLERLAQSYPIFSIEDPLDEDDFQGFADITKRLPLLIVGDDFFATNRKRLEKAAGNSGADALLLKPNMAGTLTEALDTARAARELGYHIIPSSRGGGSVDDPIPDIAVALGAPCVKFGAPRTGERTNYHNSILRIEEEMGECGRLFDIKTLHKRPRIDGDR